MLLNNTEKCLLNRQATGDIEKYCLIVCKDGERTVLHSENTDTDTYFDNASMGKVLVTSTLILKAIGEGKLSLSDTVGKFFPNCPDEKKNCTVQQLLTHSSGIIRVNLPQEVADKGHSAVAEYILSVPLAFVPGTKVQYSCNGFILLGFILEMLYGQSLDTLFYETTAKTLNLTRAKFNISADEPNSAICYRWAEVPTSPPWDDENITAMRGIAGNGGSFWSAGDMERFVQAVIKRDERLYPRDLYDLAEQNLTSEIGDGRGLGYLVVDKNYRQTGTLFPCGSFGHCGHTGQSFFISRPLNLYVILLTNATRCAMRKNEYRRYNYGDVMKLREEIHTVIASDLKIEV